MKLWSEIQACHWLEYMLEKPNTLKQWQKIFASTYEEKINSWAFRWTFACWVQNGLTILPDRNLVSNIGFVPEGTHTVDSKNKFANMPVEEISFPLKHPPFIIRHAPADDFTQRTMFERSLLTRASSKLKKNLGF